MEEHIERNKRVLEQWERFHRQEPVDESAVRPLILRSWKRCRLQGVRPDNASKVSLSPAALEKLLDRNADLVAVAKSIMEKLYNPISTSRSFISLSDAQGIVLHALWDNTGSYPIPHLAPGNLAAESASGTNAIGTCLVEHTPVETLASEHYCRSFHGWFCSAGPHQGQPERHRRRAQCDAPERPVPSPYPGDDGSGGPRHRGTAPPAAAPSGTEGHH